MYGLISAKGAILQVVKGVVENPLGCPQGQCAIRLQSKRCALIMWPLLRGAIT